MRTKALLLAAALTAAGIASIQAQSNVYSINVVGYVNVVCSNGYTLVNTPLVPTDNTLTNLLDAYVPGGSTVLTFVGGGYVAYFKDDFDLTWNGANTPLPNGSAYFIRNPGATLTVTYVGEVPQGSLVHTLPALGLYGLVGSKVPQAGFVEDLGIVPGPGDQILRFVNNGSGGGGFSAYANDDFDNTWSGAGADINKGPSVAVGEGFFYRNLSGTATWTRNFTVQ
jgi:hypothetical protein